MDNVKGFNQFGRIKYVEPNDFVGDGGLNYTHPYEDYCISVDLLVNVPNRVYNIPLNGDFQVSTSENHTVNKTTFLSGTDGYMTNTPGTLVYQDILNGNTNGINESLGISSVSITYNSYFHPEITIQFVDVRANALMGINEEIYTANERNESVDVKNFFSSLFSFPYPEFKLQVKGFYGKKVEYSLLVNDFRASFNNETGNFDATVKFIGRMYGVYTDIPMLYLLIAPYCKYGSTDGQTIWDSHNFTFDNDYPMPTFLGLRKILQDATKNQSDLINQAYVNEYQNGQKKLTKLLELKSKFNDTFSVLSKTENYHRCSSNVILIPDDYPVDNNIKTLIKSIEEVDSNLKLDGISSSKDGIAYDDKFKITFIKEDNIFTYKPLMEEDIDVDLKRVLYKKNITHQSVYHVISGKKTNIELNKRIETTQAENKEIYEKLISDADNEIVRILGFKPTIKNIFKMLMAHLQTFMEIYCTFINNVTNENSRTLDVLGVSIKNIADVRDIDVDNFTIPPFPAFKDMTNNTYCYPTYVCSNNIEETVLIDNLLNSVDDVIDMIAELNKQLESMLNGDINENVNTENENIVIPTCMTDFITRNNPYYNVFNESSTNDEISWIMTFFGIRCIQHMIISQNNDFDEISFGTGEALNFYSANQSLSSDIINKIKNNEFNAGNFIKFLVNHKNPYTQDYKPCYQNENTTNELVREWAGNLLFANTYQFPAAINRQNTDYKGIKSFWRDIEIKNNYYNSDNERDVNVNIPWYYVNNIDSEFIETVLSNAKQIDTTQGTGFYNIIANQLHCDFMDKEVYEKTTGSNRLDTLSDALASSLQSGQNSYTINSGAFVIPSNKTMPRFIEEYDNVQDFFKVYDINPIKTYYPQESNNIATHIISILQDNKIPMFFKEGLTLERLLMQMPFRTDILANKIKDGNCIIKIPYIMQLFIGMILYHKDANNNKDANNPPTMIKEIVEYLRDNNELALLGIDKVIKSIIVGGAKNNINEIDEDINYATKYAEEFLKIKYNEYSKLSGTLGKEFVESYLKERENFKTIVESYQLQEVSKENWGDYQFDNHFIKNSIIYKLENYLNNCGKENSEIRNSIDKFFISNLNGETNVFTNRYSCILKNRGNIVLILNPNFEKYKELASLFIKYNYFVFPFKYNNRKTATEYIETEKPISTNQTQPFQVQQSSIPSFSVKETGPTLEIPSTMREFLDTSSTVIVNNSLACEKTKIEDAFRSFKDGLFKLYKINSVTEPAETVTDETDETSLKRKFKTTEELKLSMYLTLKNLYDKHLHSLPLELNKYDIDYQSEDGKKLSEFKRIHYVDTFFNDLGDELCININKLNEAVQIMVGGYADKQNGILESTMNVYSFMSLLCEKANMMLMSIPFFNGSLTDVNGDEVLTDMFKPFSYNDSVNEHPLIGPSYVCLYPHQPSRHLDIPNSQYPNDGFNITIPPDLNDTANFDGPSDVSDLYNEGKYVIPAFGVEYGSQKQSIFKNINVNMDNPQTTEVSVATQFSLASKNENINKLGFEGQDLFRIYSNYSYSCQVEMMGCAQIQPLMYFQLNNIPMFRGAYQIINVEHNITPGNMSTSFKGVRLNKTKIPMVKTCIAAEILDGLIDSTYYYYDESYNDDVIPGLLDGVPNVSVEESKKMMKGNGVISDYDNYFKQYSEVAGVDWRLLAAIAYTESAFDPNAVSNNKTSYGLMQLNKQFLTGPGSSAGLYLTDFFDVDKKKCTNIDKSIMGGAKVLKDKIKCIKNLVPDYKSNAELLKLSIAAYNGGEGTIQRAYKEIKSPKWEDIKNVLPTLGNAGKESANYVPKVLKVYKLYVNNIKSDTIVQNTSTALTYEQFIKKHPEMNGKIGGKLDNIYNPSGAFNKLNTEIRCLLDSIISTANKSWNYSISSTSRNKIINKNDGSDHYYPSSNITRKNLGLDNYGCAIDFSSTTSPELFRHIATNYHESIRQLIWEYQDGPSSVNKFGNCMHMSSYGYKGNNTEKNNDKCQIFVSGNGYGRSYKAEGFNKTTPPNNLPKTYIQTIYDLRKKLNDTEFNKIKFLNFEKATNGRDYLTVPILETWLKKL